MPGPAGSPFTPAGGGSVISITLWNEQAVLARFHQRGAGMVTQVDKLCERLAESIAEAARDLVPVDTGKTKDSIRVERRQGNAVVVVDRGGDKPEVPIYLEIGTYKMAARPFLRPASTLVLAAGGVMRAATLVGGLMPPLPL